MKKKTVKKKTIARLQRVNNMDERPPRSYLSEDALTTTRKVICVNAECKLRRAGCYGYEGCPGFEAKGA